MASPSCADAKLAGLPGAQRIAAEFKRLARQIAAGKLPQMSNLSCVGDDMTVWRLELRNFDEDIPGGKQLNRDLAELRRRYGPAHNHVLLELRFPADYPTQPFFLRVVRPRMAWYTGHVTSGGSICIEALVNSGTEAGWHSSCAIDAVLLEVISNMVDCEETHVSTASGPGGRSGPLRVDLDQRWHHCSPITEYTAHEAKAAFERTKQAHGWSGGGGGGGGRRAGRKAGLAAALGGLAPGYFGAPAAPPPAAAHQSGAPRLLPQRTVPAAPPKPPAAPPVAPAAAAAAAAAARAATSAKRKSGNGSRGGGSGSAAAAAAGGGGGGSGGSPLGGTSKQAAVQQGGLRDGFINLVDMDLVDLTVPGSGTLLGSGTAGSPGRGKELSEEDIGELVANGLSRRSAIAALRKAGGDVDSALSLLLSEAAAGRNLGSPGGSAETAEGAAASPRKRSSPLGNPQLAQRAQRAQQEGSAVEVVELLDSDDEVPPSKPKSTAGRRGAATGAAAAAAAAAAAEDPDVPGPSNWAQRGGGRAPAAPAAASGGGGPGTAPSAAAAGGSGRGTAAVAAGRSNRDGDAEELLRAVLAEKERVDREKEELRRRLEEQERQHARERGLALMEPPDWWTVTANTRKPGAVEYIELPLPGRHSSGGRKRAASPEFQASEEDVTTLVANGLSRTDAMAALRKAGGDLEAALDQLLQSSPGSGRGGKAAAGGRGKEEEDRLTAEALYAKWGKAVVSELVHLNNLSLAEAAAALDHARGDVEKALGWYLLEIETKGRESLRRMARDAARRLAAGQAEEERRLQQEAEEVLKAFSTAGPAGQSIGRDRVVRIERVQNLELYTEYQRSVARVGREAGGHANEHRLWHGTSQAIMTLITQQGFDLRESAPTGALGQGIYFADGPGYSDAYARKYAPAAAAPGYGSYAPPPAPLAGLAGLGRRGAMWSAAVMGAALAAAAAGPMYGAPAAPAAFRTAVAGKAGPKYQPNAVAMAWCKVALGKPATGQGGLRKPPPGHHSTTLGSGIYAVYDNMQAYPTHIVHYK